MTLPLQPPIPGFFLMSPTFVVIVVVFVPFFFFFWLVFCFVFVFACSFVCLVLTKHVLRLDPQAGANWAKRSRDVFTIINVGHR